MQSSTVKRESLIPPAYLVSIAILLTVAFIVLLPSRETFSVTTTEKTTQKADIDDLDLAYLKARDAAGDLPAQEVRDAIHTMIRNQKWEQARQLMAERPDITPNAQDSFLLRLETATVGYYGAGNAAAAASYEAGLVSLLTDFLDTPSLHDAGTLQRASQISADLQQAEMSASYSLLLAINDPENAVTHLEQCARTLAQFDMHSESASCYRSAIEKAHDEKKIFTLKRGLIGLLISSGDTFAANAELENLVETAPQDARILSQLATLTLASERPDLAYPIYAQLSVIDDRRAIMWLEKAATWSEASNLPGLAAEYVLDIEQIADEQYKLPLTKRRQKLLLAAGRNEEALQALHQRLRLQPGSAEILIEGIDLADGMGLATQAMEWNEELLRIRPFDIDAMERQINFTLANKQLGSALLWARKTVEADPMEKGHRLKLAQLEEWNGNVQAAQTQRMWLAKHHPNNVNDKELIRLAELNWDSATAAATLRRVASREPLNTQNIIKLVKLYEQDGRPDLAAEALQEMMTGGQRDAMLLRELAALQKHHSKYTESLQAWQSFAARFGQSSEESINQMELHWRLRQYDAAGSAASRVNPLYLSSASDYQVKLYSEIGWRYRKPAYVIAAAPYLDRLDMDNSNRLEAGQRLVQSYVDLGEIETAIEHSEKLWRQTDETAFLLSTMRLALDYDVYPHLERYLDANGDLLQLREIPEYWLTLGDYYNRKSDTTAALETYENTLMILPDNEHAIAGIIWTMLGDDKYTQRLEQTLTKYESTAVTMPELWSPYAVGYMKAKKPEASLRWFSKLMEKDDHDYNILLSFADALEQTGNSNHAFTVRNYAIAKLRPLVLANAGEKTNALARDYIGLLRTYGSVGENELWTQRLLNELPGATEKEDAWRREMAAAWYLSTQRNDYARLILTKMHDQRLQTPVWQQLALALGDNDLNTIQEILASDKELSAGDRILALRKIGNEKEAYQLARHNMDNGKTENERFTAREHVIALRTNRPGYYAGALKQHDIGNLNITETGLSLRHTLAAEDLGFAVDYKRSVLASDKLAADGSTEDDVAVSAYFGNSTLGGRLTTGINTQGDSELNYSSGQYYVRDRQGRKELTTEVSFNEVVQNNAELRLAAKQDRAELAYQHSVGKNEFIKLSGNMNELTTRSDDEQISKGFGASVELGTRGSFGSNSWTMGIVATGSTSETNATLPVNLSGIPEYTTLNAATTAEAQQVAVSASLFRGGINSNYPQAASPRYHMTARLGHNWPAESVALQLHAGAGFRLMGNDELSFELQHEQSGDLLLPDSTNSTIGLQYRNHF